MVSADLTKKQYDKDSIFFKSGPPIQRNMFCISFNESDKIRMIDSPNEQVLESFKTVVAVSLHVPAVRYAESSIQVTVNVQSH